MIKFTYDGVEFVLNTQKGELLGDKSTTQYQHLIKFIGEPSQYASGEVMGSVGGLPHLPFKYTEITNPYKHIEQFSTILAVALPIDFPDELSSFVQIEQPFTHHLFEVIY